MKQVSTLSILFLLVFLMSSLISIAGNNKVKSTSAHHAKEKRMIIPENSDISTMSHPAEPKSQTEEPAKKPHLLKTDELAHIHHFHKERVKKLKRHHKKYWIMSKMLLILCHLVLLICAYLHLSH